MVFIHLIGTAWNILVVALFIYAIYDVSKDISAAYKASKCNLRSNETANIHVESVVELLVNNAPKNPEQPFSWTVFDRNLSWFHDYGDVTAMDLSESGGTLICRIHRGTTLVDEVTFIYGATFVSNFKVERFWHGRRLPFSTVSIPLQADNYKSLAFLYNKKQDANVGAIYRLYSYLDNFYKTSNAS